MSYLSISDNFENLARISSEIIEINSFGLVPTLTSLSNDMFDKSVFKKIDSIKLDIEGGELKFLEGSKKILKYKALRHLFIEVHFAKLNKLYGKNSVTKIIKILKNSDFKIFWIDSSHLHAKK